MRPDLHLQKAVGDKIINRDVFDYALVAELHSMECDWGSIRWRAVGEGRIYVTVAYEGVSGPPFFLP